MILLKAPDLVGLRRGLAEQSDGKNHKLNGNPESALHASLDAHSHQLAQDQALKNRAGNKDAVREATHLDKLV